MSNSSRVMLVGTVLSLTCTNPSWAQLFGPRTFGRPLSRRTGPGLSQQTSSGTIQGSERFLRGNRGATDFVGSDSRDARRFVGNEQANPARRVRTAVEGLRERRSARTSLNRPRGPLKAGEVYEQLALSADMAPPDVVPPGPPVTAVELSRRLTDSLARFGEARIGVSLAGRTAILRGTVASARQRELAKTMVLFEPGISQVQNQLVLSPAQGSLQTLLPPAPPLRPARP